MSMQRDTPDTRYPQAKCQNGQSAVELEWSSLMDVVVVKKQRDGSTDIH